MFEHTLTCLCYYKDGTLDKSMPCLHQALYKYKDLTQEERELKYGRDGYTLVECALSTYNALLRTPLSIQEIRAAKKLQINSDYTKAQIAIIQNGITFAISLKGEQYRLIKELRDEAYRIKDASGDINNALIYIKVQGIDCAQYTGHVHYEVLNAIIDCVNDISLANYDIKSRLVGDDINGIIGTIDQMSIAAIEQISYSFMPVQHINLNTICDDIYNSVDTTPLVKGWLDTIRSNINGVISYGIFHAAV